MGALLDEPHRAPILFHQQLCIFPTCIHQHRLMYPQRIIRQLDCPAVNEILFTLLDGAFVLGCGVLGGSQLRGSFYE